MALDAMLASELPVSNGPAALENGEQITLLCALVAAAQLPSLRLLSRVWRGAVRSSCRQRCCTIQQVRDRLEECSDLLHWPPLEHMLWNEVGRVLLLLQAADTEPLALSEWDDVLDDCRAATHLLKALAKGEALQEDEARRLRRRPGVLATLGATALHHSGAENQLLKALADLETGPEIPEQDRDARALPAADVVRYYHTSDTEDLSAADLGAFVDAACPGLLQQQARLAQQKIGQRHEAYRAQVPELATVPGLTEDLMSGLYASDLGPVARLCSMPGLAALVQDALFAVLVQLLVGDGFAPPRLPDANAVACVERWVTAGLDVERCVAFQPIWSLRSLSRRSRPLLAEEDHPLLRHRRVERLGTPVAIAWSLACGRTVTNETEGEALCRLVRALCSRGALRRCDTATYIAETWAFKIPDAVDRWLACEQPTLENAKIIDHAVTSDDGSLLL